MPHETDVTTTDWEYPTDDDVFEYSKAFTSNVEDNISIRRKLVDYDVTRDITRTVVAGSRTIYDEDVVQEAITSSPDQWRDDIAELVHGGASGVDVIAEEVSRENHYFNVVTAVDYKDKFGTRGPLLRNEDMAEYADNLIAVWDGVSNGTENMIEHALDKGLDVYVYQI